MSLSSASLKGRIKTKIQAFFDIQEDTLLDEFCQAIAEGVVEEIQTNAQVSGTVTSGAGNGGSVTGTVS